MNDVLSLRFSNGQLIYPFLRCSIVSSENKTTPKMDGKAVPKKQGILKKFIGNLCMIKIKKRNLVFFSSTLFNIKDENGKFINQLDGYYCDLYPNDCLLVENSRGVFDWIAKDTYPCLSFVNTYFLYISYILARLSLKVKDVNNPDLNAFLSKYSKLFTLYNLKLIDRQVCVYQKIIRWFLKKTHCKVLFVNCGCYGEFQGIVINVARKLGVKTIELQHGSIASEHKAYNPTTVEKECKELYQYLPEEIWTFGDYWSKSVGWNIKKVSIGNPHLNNYVNKYRDCKTLYDYLIISQWTLYEDIKSFVKALAARFPNKKIAIRLHPADDRHVYDDILTLFGNIELTDTTKNLYDDIGKSKCVIGGYSTCLYEALAFNKPLVIIDCDLSRKYFDTQIGCWTKEPIAIHEITENTNENVMSSIWKTDFSENVNKEISRILKSNK